MYAPRVFVSMIAVLIVFAVAAYWMSGSLLTAFLETVLCAVILQVGYFIGIVYMVSREKMGTDKDRTPDARQAKSGQDDVSREKMSAEAAARLHVPDR